MSRSRSGTQTPTCTGRRPTERKPRRSLPGRRLRWSGSLAVVVSHGAALGMGMSRLLGISAELRALGPLGNCSWSVLGRRRARWRLYAHNVGTLPEPVPLPEAGDVE